MTLRTVGGVSLEDMVRHVGRIHIVSLVAAETLTGRAHIDTSRVARPAVEKRMRACERVPWVVTHGRSEPDFAMASVAPLGQRRRMQGLRNPSGIFGVAHRALTRCPGVGADTMAIGTRRGPMPPE